MGLKLYYDFLSQPSRAVYMFLKLNNIEFEEKPLSLRAGEHKTEDFAKVTPMQSVPVIDDDGFILTESVAILKYLALKDEVPKNWYPREKSAQARVDEFLNWQHMGLRLPEVKLFLNLTLIPKGSGQPIDKKEAETHRASVNKSVDILAKYFLKGKQFIAGDDISIADLLCLCELMQLKGAHEEKIYESNKIVQAWMQRVKDKTKPVIADMEKKVDEVREEFKDIVKK